MIMGANERARLATQVPDRKGGKAARLWLYVATSTSICTIVTASDRRPVCADFMIVTWLYTDKVAGLDGNVRHPSSTQANLCYSC